MIAKGKNLQHSMPRSTGLRQGASTVLARRRKDKVMDNGRLKAAYVEVLQNIDLSYLEKP
jgi:hypothetical protein